MRKSRRLADRNLELALPEIDHAGRRRIIEGCFAHFGATFFELFTAQHLDVDEVRQRFEIRGWENMEAAQDLGRGVLVLCGHFGSWQVATYPLGLAVGGMSLVARPPDNPRIAADLVNLRERFGNVLLERHGVGHRVFRTIRRGGIVGIVIDQRVPPLTGILVPFFGQPARTTEVPAFVSLKTGAPAVHVTSRPINDSRYVVEIGEPIWPSSVDGHEHPEVSLTQRYLEALERDIRQRPELWLWMHDRWLLRDEERRVWETGRHGLSTHERAEMRERTGWKPRRAG